jgi:hypothetical protein
VPDRPRPKLAVTTRQPIGAVLDFLNDCLEIVAGQRTEMADAFIEYVAWCKTKSLHPMELAEFLVELEGLCPQCRIQGDRDYLVDVQFATLRGREAS